MNKRILKNFIKDHIGFTVLFFGGSLLITLFYNISTGSAVEWFYPFLITTFIFCVFLILRWFRYYPFNLRLLKASEDFCLDLSPSTCEQQEMSLILEMTHQRYMEKINGLQWEYKNNKRFISQWIHNMKTPVSIIDLVLQKTHQKEMSSDNALSDIKEENVRLLGLLDKTLQLLRLEDFSGDYLPEKLDLGTEVKRVINRRKNHFIHSGVFPRLEAPEEPVWVLSDAKWNEVILDQLLSNAIKYSGKGENPKKVYITIERHEDEVLLRIRDEGIGIPEYDLHRVFEAFFTGENGRSYSSATGIGLYLCRAIAEKLGHKIQLQSKVGQGTEVTITYLSKV
ncbi:MAG: sensor histidine kinase [Bacillota bacterium]|nr:sensor histidine kinase [Bacillota bacterium]